MNRRRRLLGLAAGMAVLRPSPHAATTVDVRNFDARGDGATNDLEAIRAAVRKVVGQGGGTVLFPPGDYWLGTVRDGGFLLPVRGARDLHFTGRGATLRCRSEAGINRIFSLADVHNVRFSGLRFADDGLDRKLTWQGAHAIYADGDDARGSQGIAIVDCTFDQVLAAFTAGGTRSRVRDITLARLGVRGAYYGLNFQDNGDRVRGSALRFTDCLRSYFPYGVDDHDITLDAHDNRSGSTDILIKSYGRPTTNLRVRVTSRGKRQGDAIVAFEQNPRSGLGVMRGVSVRLDVTEAQCALKSLIVFRSYTPDGRLEARTRNVWDDIAIDGTADFCERQTRWVEFASTPEQPARVRFGAGIPDHHTPRDPAGGFRVSRSTT